MATRLLGRSFVAFTPFLLAFVAALGFYLPLPIEFLFGCALVSAGLGVALFPALSGTSNSASVFLLVSAVFFFMGALSANLAGAVPFLPSGAGGGTTTVTGRTLRDAVETSSGLYRVPVRLESVTIGDGAGLRRGKQSWPGRGTLLFRRVDATDTLFGAPPLFWGDHFSAAGSLWCPDDSDSCLFLADRVVPREAGSRALLLEARRGARREIGVALGRLPGGVRPLTGALVLGDRGFLGSEVVDRFRGAGLSHILALSGMHLGIVAGSVALAFRKGIGKRGGAIAGIVVAWGYVLLVGPGASLLRSAVMFSIWGLFRLRGRREHPLNVLGYSFLVFILLRPEATREIGFSFSYLALVGLLVVGVPLGRFLQRWLPAPVAVPLGASAGAFLATAPLSLALFGFAAPIGIPASVVAAPLVIVALWTGMVLLTGSLFGALILPVYWLALRSHRLFLWIVGLSAEVPGVSLPAAGAALWGLALVPLLTAAIGGVIRLLRVEARRRRLEEELFLA
ncbi:MAG: ComEC/Rec2 family competence protein [Spirochaetota bacterium]